MCISLGILIHGTSAGTQYGKIPATLLCVLFCEREWGGGQAKVDKGKKLHKMPDIILLKENNICVCVYKVITPKIKKLESINLH